MSDKKFQLINGDAEEVLSKFPDNFFQCCTTSPPYYKLRNYFEEDQLGQEETPEEYVEKLVFIMRKVKRVLRKDGVCWLNIGDSYNSSSGFIRNKGKWKRKGREKGSADKKVIKHPDIKTKDLIGIPWSVAFALRKDGWYLRQDVIWSKKNTLPDGAKDRPCRAHEYIFQLTKSSKYFYDYFAIMEASVSKRRSGGGFGAKVQEGTFRMDQDRTFTDYGVRQKRSVWSYPVSRSGRDHYATYTIELINDCVASSVSEKGCCPKCRAPWKRKLKKIKVIRENSIRDVVKNDIFDGSIPKVNLQKEEYIDKLISTGWEPTCKCEIKETIPCLVLDPFNGSGTTGVVAHLKSANYVGIDLNKKYIKLSRERLLKDIFVEEVNFNE